MLREGLDVTVWNRSTEKAKPLADDGASVADSAAEAVAGADVIVTMLFDVESVASVMESAADHVRDGAVWVQTSTVGVEGTRRLVELAAAKGLDFLDVPVLGTKAPAENGKLVILASRRRCGRRSTRCSTPSVPPPGGSPRRRATRAS